MLPDFGQDSLGVKSEPTGKERNTLIAILHARRNSFSII